MNTYSHFLFNAILNKPLKKWTEDKESLPIFSPRAMLLGSVFPDVPLILITGVTIVIDAIQGNFAGGMGPEAEGFSYTGTLFNDWFFNDPWVMAAQNTFHSPVMLIMLIALSLFLWRRGSKFWGAFFWFCCGCMGHALVDIPLHVTDGPLVFFPFNWSYRYAGPISYWDSEYSAAPWAIFEHTMDLGIIVYFLSNWIKRRRAGSAVTQSS